MSKRKLGELMGILSEGVSPHHVSADEPLPVYSHIEMQRDRRREDAYVFTALNRTDASRR